MRLKSKDPSRTTLLRNRFRSNLSKRFLNLSKVLTDLVVKEDAFGLKEQPRFTLNNRWQFLTDTQKLSEFQKFLKERIDEGILETSETDPNNPWTTGFIQEAYDKGQGRAFTDVNKAGIANDLDGFVGGRQAFLQQSFGHPVAIEKVNLLGARVFTNLRGITEAMSDQIARELAEGLIRGDNPRQVGARISGRVKAIGRRRAETLARTEIIRAHAEGQLDALDRMGVEEVGVAVEWSTAGDDRVCPLCQPLEGVVMTIQEARGLIPRHANCRCAYIPANVGEDKRRQKRSKAVIDRAKNRSIKAEIPQGTRRTLKEQKKLTQWPGADRRIAKARPKDILDE